ncbi:exopolysaccharide biosynthesis protein [Rhizobium halophilum]|uniref:exopolysaccharide biosynthesis protein n=1 Tax=Rhizobium halophilum TaxID=2846852 RepID=UPI001EFDC6C2|nr:exopolysaccharide biosynthesis protein [Rhizobium halophilum]MCF6370156.1 exopolysaccharide biosynthesis protein [Rhizobium halophilum]
MPEAFEFNDSSTTLSETLRALIGRIDGKTVSLREMMAQVGEHGLLLMCALASLPFLIPVSIPGVSTVFGFAIILISLSITFNRLPWLPKRILDRRLDTTKLVPALEKGASLVSRLDAYIKPRMASFVAGRVMNRLNGLAIAFGGVLLMFPLGFVPLSNTLPGIAILLLATGMIQRDGLIVAAGYAFLVFTAIYFVALGFLAFSAGQGLAEILR